MRALWALLAAFVLFWVSEAQATTQPDYGGFYAALRHVESGGRDRPPDGDGGRAIGPYQVWESYFNDARAADPSIRSLSYQDCRDPDIAAMVVGAYLRRWALEAYDRGDWETLARIHNGGPRGASKAATLAYWKRVQAVLEGRKW